MLQKIKSWALAHPGVVHWMEALLYAVAVADFAYFKTLGGSTAPLTLSTVLVGLGNVSFVALKLYLQTTISANQGTIVAWAQDFLESNPSTAPQTKPVPAPATAALTVLKASMLLVGFLLFATSPASAGYLISQPKHENTALTLPSGTALYLMPIAGFDVGASLPKPTYGFDLNEDVVFGNESPLNGDTNLAPIVGAGLSVYADAAGPINNNGPLYLLVGANIVGPDLDLLGLGNGQGLVPHVMWTHNFVTNEDKVTGGLTVFPDLGPGTATKLAGN